jgi:DNA-binding transcriptional LysR family regulator
MLPDIDSLALFVRAAELHSLTKAADASHIGAAAASRRIALLEHRFRTSLLERSPRGVELTPAGVALLAHAKALLAQLNGMEAEMSGHASGRRGALRVLANTSALAEYLPDDLASFAKQHPDIVVIVQERWSPEIRAALLAGEADIGLVMEGIPTDGLELHPYRSDQLAAVMPPDHPLAMQTALKFDDVLDFDLIALEGGSSMMRLLTEQAVASEKPLKLRVQVRSFDVVCRMVQTGLGIGLLPYQAARTLAEGLSLKVRPLAEDWARRPMLVCTKKDRVPNVATTLLLDHLRAGALTDQAS